MTTTITVHDCKRIMNVRLTPENSNAVSFSLDIVGFYNSKTDITLFDLPYKAAKMLSDTLTKISEMEAE